MINTAAAEQLGRPVALHEDDIAACLDPVRNVAARESLGGPAPRRVRAHIAEQKGLLDQYRGVIGAGVQRVADAQALLQRRVGKLVSSKPAERSVQEA